MQTAAISQYSTTISLAALVVLLLTRRTLCQSVFQPGALQAAGTDSFTPDLYHGIVAAVGPYKRYVIAGVDSTVNTWDISPSRIENLAAWNGLLGLGLLGSSPYSSSNPFAYHAFLMEPDSFVYFSNGEVNSLQLSPTASSDTLSLGNRTVTSQFTLTLAGTALTGTNLAYVALLPTSIAYKLARWDKTSSSLTGLGVQAAGTARGLLFITADKVMVGGSYNALQVYDRATLTLVQDIVWLYQTALMLSDNLDSLSTLIAHYGLMAGTYGVSRLRYDGQSPVAAQTTADQTSRVSSMINLGTFNYILASYPSASSGLIFDKSSLTPVQSFEFTYAACSLGCNPQFNTMAFAGMDANNQVNFILHSCASKVDSRSVMPIVPSCSAYSGALCTGCTAGYYLLASTG